MTIREVCDSLSISRTLLYELCKSGRLRSLRVGTRGVRIPEAEVERFIHEGLVPDPRMHSENNDSL